MLTYRFVPAAMVPDRPAMDQTAFRSAALIAAQNGRTLDAATVEWTVVERSDVPTDVTVEGSPDLPGPVLRVAFDLASP